MVFIHCIVSPASDDLSYEHLASRALWAESSRRAYTESCSWRSKSHKRMNNLGFSSTLFAIYPLMMI